LNHRLYYTATKDFRTYSKAELFYDDGFNVIDGTIVKAAGRYLMILKDETAVPTQKNLRLAWSDKAAGPYGKASAPFTINWVEGPTAIKIADRWMVYFDLYRDKRYSAMRSSDLKNWENVTEQLAFPAGARHGTVLTVSDEVMRRLKLKWADALNQSPAWRHQEEAVRIADNVLLYQRSSGGWPKNIDMAGVLSQKARAEVAADKSKTDSTIDNGATYTQLSFLAAIFNTTKETRFRDSFIKGFDYLIKAQYPIGGWPQYYPNLTGYYTHITYNDEAMVGVMELLDGVAGKSPVYSFVDEDRRLQAKQAVEKGVECILKTQIIVDGRRTAWCAQHDEVTLAPAPARTYEKVSLSGSETVGIVRFLMKIERPSPQIRESIEAAIAWLEQVKLTGIKLVEKPDPTLPRGFDRVVVNDSRAAPLWARFYELGTNRPIFSGRDSIIKASLAEIEYERRTGYNWYTTAPAKLLTQDYPAWRKKNLARGSRGSDG
jgi:PelA/Pel-15E family pectate lyase